MSMWCCLPAPARTHAWPALGCVRLAAAVLLLLHWAGRLSQEHNLEKTQNSSRFTRDLTRIEAKLLTMILATKRPTNFTNFHENRIERKITKNSSKNYEKEKPRRLALIHHE